MTMHNLRCRSLVQQCEGRGWCWPGTPQLWKRSYGPNILREIQSVSERDTFLLGFIRHGNYINQLTPRSWAEIAHATWLYKTSQGMSYGYAIPFGFATQNIIELEVPSDVCNVLPSTHGFSGCTEMVPWSGWERALILGAQLYRDILAPLIQQKNDLGREPQIQDFVLSAPYSVSLADIVAPRPIRPPTMTWVGNQARQTIPGLLA